MDKCAYQFGMPVPHCGTGTDVLICSSNTALARAGTPEQIRKMQVGGNGERTHTPLLALSLS